MIKRLLLLSLFLVLMTAEMLAIDLSLAPGLSIKNAYLYMFLLAIVVEAAIRKQEGRLECLNIHVPFILLISYATLSWLIVSLIVAFPGYEMLESLITLKNQLVDRYLFFFVFFYWAGSQKDVLWMVKYIIWIIVLGNVITLIDVYNIPDLGIIHERADGRVSGPLGQSNQYAAFLILFLPSLALASWRGVGLTRLCYILGLLASIAVLILTTSRGAIIGLAGGIILGTLYLRPFIRLGQFTKTAMVVAILGALALSAVSYQYSDLLYARFVDQAGAENIGYVSSGRTDIWIQTLSLQMEKPVTFLIGYGWETYDVLRDFRRATHSTYVNYLFNLGIIGLGLFLILVGNVIRTTKKGIQNSDVLIQAQLIAFLFGFLSLLIHLFFVDLYKPWFFIWAYIGLMMRLAIGASMESQPMSSQDKAHASVYKHRGLAK